MLSELKKYIKGPNITYSKEGITYINWNNNYWLEGFIKHNFPNVKLDEYCFCSVNGKRPNFNKLQDKKKIFFSIENLADVVKHNKCSIDESANIYRWLAYARKYYSDYMLNDVDLSLAFIDVQADNYMRFPYWLTTLFPPDVTYTKIKEIVSAINRNMMYAEREAICINTHDVFGIRKFICNDLSNVLRITYAGKWRNNTDELWSRYNDDKYTYIKLFKFNICPENMDAPDYCTEKIFDALRCCCIPIYAGCLNNPEPEIINKDFVIFWDLDGDNTEQLKLVKRLNSDNEFYKKFVNQPKLKPDAANYIAEYFENLKQKLKEVI